MSISKASLEIEEGDSDTYEVELDTQPTGDVTVTIGGTTGTDLTLDKDTLTFSEQNWDQPQTVTVTADHDDDAVDETLVFAVADFAAFTDGAGETRYRQSVYFDVVIVDNSYDEDAETFLLKLMESPGYEGSVFGVPQTEVTINDDDTAG